MLFGLVRYSGKCGRVAQLVEQVTFNHWVTGSNPVALTIARMLHRYKAPPAASATGGFVYGRLYGRKSYTVTRTPNLSNATTLPLASQ